MAKEKEKFNVHFSSYQQYLKIPKDFEYDQEYEEIIRFFNRSAKKCVKEFISKVFIIKNENDNFIGYIALSLCSIEKQLLKKTKSRGIYERPAIRIGQLIIDNRYQNRGYGSVAIKFVIAVIRMLSVYLPCRLLVVDAINKKAKNFYKKKGFEELPDQKETLVLDLAPILRKK